VRAKAEGAHHGRTVLMIGEKLQAAKVLLAKASQTTTRIAAAICEDPAALY
jgi:hypothetical protein